ncbi:hypothetical protein BH23ACT2_BH23ACT2_30980 [soil metagenome]
MTAPGRLVAGRYRLRGRIADGGMGTVWLADDERLGREVAIKELLPPADTDPATARQQRERALREGRIAARLSHPHAISVYDVALEDDQPWLVMEYLPSRSLAAVLTEDGVLRVDQTAQIGAQIADALTATHAAGIVHRDVKPANVLIGRGERIEGLVKITDFGISHASGDVTLTQTGLITGTPAFLAPEVAQGIEQGPAADVFSLGATLYTCLEGQPPFGRGDNALQQLHRVAAGTIAPPQRSGALTRPLLRMLAADPAARPAMEEVRDELASLAAGGEGDTATVLAAPMDITSPASNIAGATPPPGGEPAGPSADPELAEVPSADPEVAEPTAREAVGPAGPAATGDAGGRRRIRPLGWVAAAMVVVLAALTVSWALVSNGDADTDTASPGSTAPTSPATSDTDTDTDEPSTGGDASADPEVTTTTTTPTTAPNETTTTTEATAGGPNGDGAIEADSVEQYLDQYHQAVVDDPAAAYEQAGPTLRDSISLAGFEEFWAPFEDVAISDVEVEEGGDSALAVMELSYPDGTRQVQRHQFDFIDEDGRLVLDRDSFVEMIEFRG